MTKLEVSQKRMVLWCVTILFGGLLGPSNAQAQALAFEQLPNGSRLVRVEMPLADATSVAWPTGDGSLRVVSGGELTLTLALEEALSAAADPTPLAPPILVAVGAAGGDDLVEQLGGWLSDRPLAVVETTAPATLTEGAVTRRLRPAGSPTTLSLRLPLPTAESPYRSDVEVLYETVPELLRPQLPHLRVVIGETEARLTTVVEPTLGELTLRKLRLALARLADTSSIVRGAVESSRQRLLVARRARLEEHPDAAISLLEVWLAGGADGLRQQLFGLDSVTLESVRSAAAMWLPLHPGHALLDLPPHAMSPRFAAGPRRLELDTGAIVSILERPGADLATLVLRPVLLPDLDGAVSATVLTRLAGALRERAAAPEWIRVHPSPPWLELAAHPDRFPELVEAVHAGLVQLRADTAPATADPNDPRRRALDLLALRLGATRSPEVSPGELLRPSNLVVGAVVEDAETAVEAFDKLLDQGADTTTTMTSSSLSTSSRRRIAMGGSRASVAAAIRLPADCHWTEAATVARLIEQRCATELEQEHQSGLELSPQVFQPVVPGQQALVITLTGRGDLETIEAALLEAWPRLLAPAADEELARLVRTVAAELTQAGSGVLGRARTVAAVAAGLHPWEPAMAMQLRVLTLSSERIEELLGAARPVSALELTGAGRLPVDGVPIPQ